MNPQIKNWLGIAAIACLVMIGAASISYVRSYARTTTPYATRTFEVQGTGKAMVTPDVATFNFSVRNEGGVNDLVKLQNENTDRVNKVMNYLTSKGIKKEDIGTVDYSVNPNYTYAPCDRVCPPPVISGYTVFQNATVKVRDLKVAGELLSGVVQNGANEVSNLSFVVDDQSKYENIAREEAIKEAMKRAEQTASASGFKVGRLVWINNQPNDMYGAKADYGMGGSPMASSASPEVQGGTKTITATVMMTFEMK